MSVGPREKLAVWPHAPDAEPAHTEADTPPTAYVAWGPIPGMHPPGMTSHLHHHSS